LFVEINYLHVDPLDLAGEIGNLERLIAIPAMATDINLQVQWLVAGQVFLGHRFFPCTREGLFPLGAACLLLSTLTGLGQRDADRSLSQNALFYAGRAVT